MKTLMTISLILFTTFIIRGQNTIDVSISGFKNEKGKAMVGLYNSKSDFLKNTYKSLAAPILHGKVQVSFKDIPNGVYAVSVYHDENGNGKLDRFMGMMPTEDYGNSNNVDPGFGPPKWEDAMFETKKTGATDLNIELR